MSLINIETSQKQIAVYNPQSKIKSADDQLFEERMGEIVARTVQEICADYEKRRWGWRNDHTLLEKGIWTANEYYHALKEVGAKAKPRLKTLIDKGYFYHPLPPEHFERIISEASPSGYSQNSIVLKEDIQPSAALSNIKTMFSLLDGTMVCQIGQYQALYEVLGEAKFNKLFSRKGKYPMVIGSYDGKISLCNGFLSEGSNKSGVKGERPIKVGEVHCFKNIQMYTDRHTVMGESGAVNVVPISSTFGNQKFVGLGLPGSGVSEEEIEQYLIDQYNQKPLDLEPLNDKIANKIHPGGKIGYQAVCDYLDLQATDEDKKKLWEKYESLLPSDAQTDAKAFLDSLAVPFSKETIQYGGFGYDPQSSIKFNVPSIQILKKTRLKKI
jgi:hypothetical protein